MRFFRFCSFFIFFLFPLTAFAVPVVVPLGTARSYTALGPYVIDLYKFSIGAGAILAMTMIVVGAVQYIISAGNPGSQSDARDRITSAIYGLALLLGAFVILFTINPAIVGLGALDLYFPEPPPQPPAREDIPRVPPFGILWVPERSLNMQWNDPCSPTPFNCSFEIFRSFYDRSSETWFTESISRLNYTGENPRNYNLALEAPNKIFLNTWWYVQSIATPEGTRSITPLGDLASSSRNPDAAEHLGLLQLTGNQLPDAPTLPLLQLDREPRLSIVDNSGCPTSNPGCGAIPEATFRIFAFRDFRDAPSEWMIARNSMFLETTGLAQRVTISRSRAEQDGLINTTWEVPSRWMQDGYCKIMVIAPNSYGQFTDPTLTFQAIDLSSAFAGGCPR
ncbi:MAG: hypothetical protein COU08_00970 [Candidatus Harrisonbacteria bacterium CG10_big_fil_rev_8_21_14_0_10_42_17]|uniref:Fibronectin type-III domain-containing protein n=1 Tax=Candidatus Harrisonbacteria bacterium CG10_big_fil_rev_8_21_14_0_10_42_17 TaxID=1974584 RepID=A0A2M6WIU4_9BACT|nr:MAG: hypothetical protein COU08_00970 [Candidatus Harrisonbacteria bacterium CG10_big_fil_rev_8_21_14_0_10_42_17]